MGGEVNGGFSVRISLDVFSEQPLSIRTEGFNLKIY